MDAAMNNQEILAMIRQEIAANNAAQAQARSFSQGTTNFGLPQWEPNDKPTFLVDMNGAYRTIDTQMQANKNDANSAITAAESANTLSNQALTASRENAQNIVTLTNNLTNANNTIEQLGKIYQSNAFTVGDNSLNISKADMTIWQMYSSYFIPIPFKYHIVVSGLTAGTPLPNDLLLGTFTFPTTTLTAGRGTNYRGSISYQGSPTPPVQVDQMFVSRFTIIFTNSTAKISLQRGFTPHSDRCIILC